MRRHLEIFVAFLKSTGHPHPRLEAAVRNYIILLVEMKIELPDVREKVKAAGVPDEIVKRVMQRSADE